MPAKLDPIAYPELDEARIRQDAVFAILARIERQARRMSRASQLFGAHLMTPEWREYGHLLTGEECAFSDLMERSRYELLKALRDVPVVHDAPKRPT